VERRFACTACGKCCYGQLPLTIDDALTHADKFPLVVAWTPVRQGARSFRATADMGVVIQLKKRKQVAVRIAPTAYIPPRFPCPELTEAGLCGVHDAKPQRCRTMPFSAYRDEADQDDLLLPRLGWACDISEAAPVVYRDKKVVTREEFDAERDWVMRDAVVLKPYVQWLLDSMPSLDMELRKIAQKPRGGRVLVTFSTLIPKLPKVDIYAFAAKQFAVMQDFADRTADDPALVEFHQRYVDGAKEWKQVVSVAPKN
jgi:Fe-S-cluster containining protein